MKTKKQNTPWTPRQILAAIQPAARRPELVRWLSISRAITKAQKG